MKIRSLFPLLLILLLIGTACQTSRDEALARQAREWTETNCPRTLDEATRIDSLTYSPATRTLTYWYSVVGQYDNESTYLALRNQEDMLRKQFATSIRTSTEIKDAADSGVNFEYVYRSARTGARQYVLVVTPKDYR
ncbi:MAG: hypothetical protein J6M53_07390 [Bacteroidaceae bacterium]|nr:hypothetical protein [Bacteroidaceae bacterium]